jgi:hypothetical protein
MTPRSILIVALTLAPAAATAAVMPPACRGSGGVYELAACHLNAMRDVVGTGVRDDGLRARLDARIDRAMRRLLAGEREILAGRPRSSHRRLRRGIAVVSGIVKTIRATPYAKVALDDARLLLEHASLAELYFGAAIDPGVSDNH